ncbi:hypothetical protein AK812_SmicGene29078 [Symbiodinium microadriaticum]|uniref:Apple domain-containing protein n=1 Tax=Symbiodinium microadriaticum TaxID=2951 RepID=A0A1Q9D2R1_SYMMI|nr:hypothetical protein AK812_SmicGene29078 [Symbiodinium microadriaticum]
MRAASVCASLLAWSSGAVEKVPNVPSAHACCELCYAKSSCQAALYEEAEQLCRLGGPRMPVTGLDYEATRGLTLQRVETAEQCCTACESWEDCKVGVWDEYWHECYLKSGFVSRRISTKPLVGCMARASSPEAFL